MVHRLDRLGRPTCGVLSLVRELDAKGRRLASSNLKSSRPMTWAERSTTIFGIVADMERKFILDRQRAGIEAATGKAVQKDRKASGRCLDSHSAMNGVTKAQIATISACPAWRWSIKHYAHQSKHGNTVSPGPAQASPVAKSKCARSTLSIGDDACGIALLGPAQDAQQAAR